VSLHFLKGGEPPSAQNLADELNVPLLLLENVLVELEQQGFLVETTKSEPGWLPARDPSEVQVSEVIGALRGTSTLQVTTPVLQLAESVIRQGWDGSRAILEGVTIRDLLKKTGT
jgi:DNA-binding IscR family transcriptional regulator